MTRNPPPIKSNQSTLNDCLPLVQGNPSEINGYQQLLGKTAWRRLHPDIRRRFELNYADNPVIYKGVMNQVYLSFFGKVLAQLCRLIGTPLALYSENDVPTRVDVYADKRLSGITWDRFYFYKNKKVNRVRSTKVILRDSGLVEIVGFGFGMQLELSEVDGAIQFTSQNFFWQIGKRKLTIPALLTPGKTIVRQTALANRAFEFSLNVEHPVLGLVFYQKGIFRDEATM